MIRWAGGECGKGLLVESGVRFRKGLHLGVKIGARVLLGKDTTIDCARGAELNIGNNVTLTQGVFIAAESRVTIGDDTLIGEYCSVRDADHGIVCGARINGQPMASAPITIGIDVWIGRGCAVLKNASIGDGAVIGANSVVKGTIEANMIAAGAPARIIRTRPEGNSSA